MCFDCLHIAFTLVGQWGQNKVFADGGSEDRLWKYCERQAYDVIIVKAINVFFDVGPNKGNLSI